VFYSGKKTIIDEKVIDNKSLYIGNKDKKVCIYDKKKEIEENPSFLNNYFENIYSDYSSLERVEVRIFNKGMLKYKDKGTTKNIIRDIIDINRLDDKDYLNELFNYYFNDILQIKYVDKNKRTSLKDCKNVKFLNIDKNNIIKPLLNTKEYEKMSNKQRINRVKRDIANIENHAKFLNDIINECVLLGLDVELINKLKEYDKLK